MAALRRDPQQSWFVTNSGVALFLAGFAMVIFALIVLLARENTAGVVTALILLGTAVMLIGGLLPRLAGTIKITPGSIQLSLLERLEATRQEAVERSPDRVQEAVGRAYEELVPQLQADGSSPIAAGSQGGAETAGAQEPPKAARPLSAWQKVLTAVSLMGVGAVLAIGLLVLAAAISERRAEEPTAVGIIGEISEDLQGVGQLEEELREPDGSYSAPYEPPLRSERQTEPVIVAVAVGLSLIVVLLAGLWIVRRRRTAGAAEDDPSSLVLELPAVFAQRIVDDITGQDRTNQREGGG